MKKIIKAHFASLPKLRASYCYSRHSVGHLDRKNKYETGGASSIRNIDTQSYPFISSARQGAPTGFEYRGKVLDFTVCDGTVFALTLRNRQLYLSEYKPKLNTSTETPVIDTGDEDPEHYCIVRYNEFTSHTNAIEGSYVKKVLVFPHYFSGEIDGGGESFFETCGSFPASHVATVFMSRIFSAYKGKLFASDFNSAMTYSFDTAEESLSSNAWMSNTQSNTKADGDITALAVYDGHVVVFKRDYMMQVYNNENPFRLVDIGSYGCISKRAVCEYDGKLAFVSPQGVMLYSGGYPYFIDEELDIKSYEGALLCAREKLLYMYVPSEKGVFVYDSEHGMWGHRDIADIEFMCADHTGAYYLKDSKVYELDCALPVDFYVATDRNTLGSDMKKRLCGVGFTAVMKDGSELDVQLADEHGNTRFTLHIEGAGEHIVRQRVKGVSVNFAQLIFSGIGEVSIGEYWLKYRKEDGI